jgi:hypothetical protein
MARKIAAILALLAALSLSALAHSSGGFVEAGGKCSPGQHGNPHPGFKPGVC